MITYLFVKWFKLKGWKITETIPSHIKKCVAIAAPHTSNWDFIYTLAAWKIMGIEVKYFVKKELFWWPLSILLHKTGGIAINRKVNQNVVEAMVEELQNNTHLIVLMSAEGTRKSVNYWKSGFYHIAKQANVPIMMGYLDYKNKEAGFGQALYVTENIEQDLEKIKTFYATKTGKNADNFSVETIRFKN